MRKDKTKRKLINKITTLSMSLVLFVTVILTIFAVSKTATVEAADYIPTTSTYSSNQVHIVNPNVPSTSETVTMTEAYNDISSANNKTILITSDDELYLFSLACAENTNYLSKNYRLASNIYYDIDDEFIPIGYNGTPFSGTFDGNGYEISNLKMVDITSQINNESRFANMYYYAMFSDNKGTIENLGVVESRNAIVSVELDKVVTAGGVANLVGHNQAQGTVKNCYYRDLRDMIEDEIGLAFYGQYRIAGLVYLNDGIFQDCYVAVSTVVNHKISGYESISGICSQNNNYNAETSNLYYYDGSIQTYREISGGIEITYKDEVFNDATFLDATQNVGKYCQEVRPDIGELSSIDLNYYYLNNSTWYLPEDYGDLSIYVKNPTPILRGLSYTKNEKKYTFAINDVDDFIYMFELMNDSDAFAGDNAIYSINSDINLKNIDSSQFIYKKIITSTITGTANAGTIKPTLIDNTTSSYPSIYNFDSIDEERKTTTLGIDAYGLFPYFGGHISNLNIIPTILDLSTIDDTNNVKGIAALSGYAEKATIDNINVYITTTHASRDIKEFYLGSVVGVLGGESTIQNCTASGTYQMSKFSISKPATTAYTGGIAIGGVVGYICETYGSVKDSLSAVNMQLNMDAANVDFEIGGVVGAAYTIDAKNLENIGSITVGENDYSAKYNNIYIGGVIGRHFGVKKEIESLTNQGNIQLYGYPNNASTNIAYVSGIENADILTSPVANTGLIASTYKAKDGNYKFVASGLTNRANISINRNIIADSTEYTSGINILSKNGFVSDLTGVYNLNYTYKYNGNSKVKETLGDQALDMYLAHKYSGVVNVINGGTPNVNAITNLTTVYNLRNIAITTSTAIGGSINFEYYGTVRGKYINYSDVRNEGNITLTASKALGTANTTTSNIILAGVLEEVSEGCKADDIFNGGNISITYSNVNINGNVIASGICYKNKGYDASTINQYNPALNEFNSKAKGAINNAINNGTITVDNPTNFNNIGYKYTTILSANGQSNLGSLPETTYGTVYNILGDIFVSGITAYNEAPITNTFNLTDLFASNFINDKTNEKEINVAGLVGFNIGQYAYILNSANNGNLKGINLSSEDGTLSNVNVAGIVARNDELENGTNYTSSTTNSHSKQIISFTINYGDVFSYNFRQNIATTAYEPSAKAAGIVAMGLLNTINVMNYGNVYGSETASGIFGIMYFARFASEVDQNNKVYIANTINYGNVYMLSKGYNNAHSNTSLDYEVIKYARFKELTTANIKITDSTPGNNEAFTNVVRNTDYISIIGSVFAVANYATSNAAENITIRYLISFNEQCSIVGETVAAPTNASVATDTLYSAHISVNAATGANLNDKWINSYVQYAPLSTGSITDRFVTNIDASTGYVTTNTNTYYGIFNSNFTFSKAILGKIALDLTHNPTDAYLTDYFQFVGFQYINPILFEKIGWQAFAYKAAADDFATNVSNVMKVLDKATSYDTYKATAKDASSWMNNSLSKDLDLLIDSMIEEENYSDLISVLQYIYSDDSQSSIYIDKTLRTSVLNELITNEDQLLTVLDEVLNYKNGYSTALAKSIVTNEDEVKTYISNYIDNLSASDLSSMLQSYIDYLDDTENQYFRYGTNEKERVTLLTTLFNSIDDATFYSELISILGISDSSVSDSIKMFVGYQQMSAADKKTLFETIISYNYNQNKLDEYLDDMGSNVDFYSELVANGYNISSISSMYTLADLNSASTATGEAIIDERVKLWNLIKNTNVFRNNYSTFNIPSTTYFKATEYNNTYQSVTEPHNNGAFLGDTSENRLSYMYTLDITPQVYFYGPYTDNSGSFRLTASDKVGTQTLTSVYTNTKNLNSHNGGYFSLFHYIENSLWSSNEIMKSRGNRNISFSSALTPTVPTTYTAYSVPALVYYDYNNEQLGGANGQWSTQNSWYSGDFGENYAFRGFSDNQQFKYDKNKPDPMIGGTTNYKTNDWTGTLFGTNDWYMRVSSTGETFSLNYAVLAKAYKTGGKKLVTLANGSTIYTNDYRCYIQDADGAYHLIQTGANNTYDANATIEIGKMENNIFVAKHTMKNYNDDDNTRNIYSLISYIAGLRMYTSTVNTIYHSTGRTGIYRYAGGWDNYFTWKQTGGEGNHRVFTSQYIDYNHSDLFNLDGVLTEYDGSTKSSDERYIINYLFNTYFLTSSKYETFRRLVQAALLESLGDSTTRGAAYIDSFMLNNIYTSARTNLSNSIPFAYLNRQNNQTVQSYLNTLYSGTNPNNKQLLIYGAASNQFKYIELLKRLKAASNITTNNDYANLENLLIYLRLNPSYISNNKIIMSNFSALSASELGTYFGSLDNENDVELNSLYDVSSKISAYQNLVVVKNQSIYNSTTYDYGLKFSSITLTPSQYDTRITMVAKSTGASSTLTNGSDNINVTTIGEYYFDTNAATTITITSNSDVIVYSITYEGSADTNEISINNSTYQLLSSSDFESVVSNNIPNANFEKAIATFNISNSNNQRTLFLYNDTDNQMITSVGQVPTSGATYELDISNYYSKTISIRYRNNNAYYTNNAFKIVSVVYTISFVTNINNSTIYKNRILNSDFSYLNAQNCYFSYIMRNSDTLYNTFEKSNLVNFAAYNISGNDSNPTNPFVNRLTDEEKKTFARLVITNSNEGMFGAIKALATISSNLGDVLKVMDAADNGYAYIADAIYKLDNTVPSGSSTDLIDQHPNLLKTLVAAYIVSNYRSTLNQGKTAYNTIYYSLVSDLNSNATGNSTSGTAFRNNINYINSDGSFTASKFDLFSEYVLGEATATSSYGIFALSSSRGIQNGAFIPDNVSLSSMDAKYDTTKKINNVSYIELTDAINTSWRDKTGASTDIQDVSNHSSVNYHVIEEMKQLVKAISNVIFELDLTVNDATLYSSENQIDYESKVITYYVSETYLNYIKDASSLTIKKIIFADTATSNKHDNDSITLTKSYVYKEVTVTDTTFDSTKHYIVSNGQYELATSYVAGTRYYELNEINVSNAVTITPEEHAYTANYSIRFIKVDNTITTFTYASMYYAVANDAGEPTSTYTTTNTRTIPYYGSKITFNVTAPLPDGMDLKSFFNITGQTLNDTWTFDPDTDNNGIISNGEAKIVINVDISMNQGSKSFVLKIYDQSKTINITKDPNRNALITLFGYDGTDYTSSMQTSKTASSTILFGRAFNYSDLTLPYIKTTDTALNENKVYYVQTGTNNSYAYTRVLNPVVENIATYFEANPDFYLYQFSISPNATVAITATKEIDADTGLMTYEVSYVVKSEYGTTQTYTHSLTEHSYFDDETVYGTLYKSGEAVDSEGIHTKDFNYGTTLMDGSLSSLTYDDAAENYVAVIFNRGYQPEYRIRYNLAYFYGDITHYTVTQGTNNSSETELKDTYAGITITIDDDQQPGTYKFNYVYTNTGEWTSEGSYVKLSDDAIFDENMTYYELDNGVYVIREVTSRTFSRLKSRLYTYVQAGDPSYTRTYEFPALYIIKDYAIDALFHKLSFLDESIVLGGTASVMLPTTPISAGSANTDADSVIYNSVFGANNDIKINPNSIDYKNDSDNPSVTDYYTVGTVSDTDLENYAPTIKVEDHAQVFKYTTISKLKKYGSENKQTLSDSAILSDRAFTDDTTSANYNAMLLYVPFTAIINEVTVHKVFLVLLDTNMKWKKVYDVKYDGKDETKLLYTYSTEVFNTIEAEADPSLTTFSYTDPDTNLTGSYSISSFAGSTDVTSVDDKNISLFMDYVGNPLEDHFWYVSYVVFSEYYLNKGITDLGEHPDGIDDLGAVRYYHISIVDASNTVYFDVSLYAPTDFKLDEIYLTFAENVYDKETNVSLGSYQLSCYLEKAKDEQGNLIYGAAETEEAGLVLYTLKFSMAALPAGYFTFSLDLPNGYGAICYTNKVNELDDKKEPGKSNPDSYLPHTTIIPITIGLKIIVSELTDGTSSVWAINTSDLYTRRITYKGSKDF